MYKFSFPIGKSSAIFLVDGVLDPSLCNQFIDYMAQFLETEPLFHPGKTHGGLMAETKNSTDCFFANSHEDFANARCTLTETFEDEVMKAVNIAISAYREQFRFLWKFSNMVDTGYSLQVYRNSFGFYREHIDSFPGSETSNRVLSIIVYLNDVEHGGETVFPLHEVSVSPKAGRICIFPSLFTHPHSGNVPFQSDKWIIQTFIEEKSNDQTKTDQIINIDTSINSNFLPPPPPPFHSHSHLHQDHLHDHHIEKTIVNNFTLGSAL